MEQNTTNDSGSIDFVLLDAEFGSNSYSTDPDRLRSWFQSVRKFATWAGTIFFVSRNGWPEEAGNMPPEIVCILPRDILPESFSSSENGHAIQANLHRIPGLANQFVVFHADQCLTHPSVPEDWFRNGLPVDTARLGHAIATYRIVGDSYIALNEDSVIQRRFGGRRFVLSRFWKWLLPWNAGCKAAFWNAVYAAWGPCPGFRPVPSPVPLLRKTMESVWATEPELLRETTERPRSDMKDLSIRLFRVWQLACGTFAPCRPCVAANRASQF